MAVSLVIASSEILYYIIVYYNGDAAFQQHSNKWNVQTGHLHLRCIQEFWECLIFKGNRNGMILSKDFELHFCPLNPTMYFMVNDLPYISIRVC